MAWSKTWTVVFRCYACSGKFTVRHVTFEKIEELHTVQPCPFCGAKPLAQQAQYEHLSKGHKLVELSDEMELVYRRPQQGDTWHFDPACSRWPTDDFIALEAAPRMEQMCNECSKKSRRNQ